MPTNCDILIHEHLLWMRSGYDVGKSTDTQVKLDQNPTYNYDLVELYGKILW